MSETIVGTVKWFNGEKGFGFIEHPGFECYAVKMRIAPTGNSTASSLVPVFPMAK